jgi:chemotaxis family two-component system response regulator Rcp1
MNPEVHNTIMVVEDNPADLWLVREALKSHRVHCVIRPVRDGEQALKLINSDESRVDLFTLDKHLPKHGGEEILTCLRAEKHYARTPVIMMTALETRTGAATVAGIPAMVYFPKPSTVDEFMDLGSIVAALFEQDHRPRRPAETATESGRGTL